MGFDPEADVQQANEQCGSLFPAQARSVPVPEHGVGIVGPPQPEEMQSAGAACLRPACPLWKARPERCWATGGHITLLLCMVGLVHVHSRAYTSALPVSLIRKTPLNRPGAVLAAGLGRSSANPLEFGARESGPARARPAVATRYVGRLASASWFGGLFCLCGPDRRVFDHFVGSGRALQAGSSPGSIPFSTPRLLL